MTPPLLDLQTLTEQVAHVTKKVQDDMEFVQEHKPDMKSVTILLADIILLQAVQASLTLAFLERWADDHE